MARLPRLTLADVPHYVIQRGNNLQPIFEDGTDFQAMRDLLREMARRFGIDVHAYVLLPNQFHVLATPEGSDRLPSFMQSVGRSYVRYFNNRHARSGTLWEGRYRSTVMEAASYLLPCMVVLEHAPVRLGLARSAVDYPWSSCSHNAGVRQDPLVRPHALYWQLGNTPFAREAAYKQAVEQGMAASTQEDIESAALRGWALGTPDFVARLQQQTERRLTRRRPGRPPRATAPTDTPA